MRAQYKRNDVVCLLPRDDGNNIQEYCYELECFSFPEDENSELELKFWINEVNCIDIPFNISVQLKHKNPKISIQYEFKLVGVHSSGNEVVIIYRA